MRDEGGGYLGRFQQGQEVPLVLYCTTAAVAPQDPATLPVASVYLDGSSPTLVETLALAADLRGVEDGVFRLGLFLGQRYGTPGRYLVVLRWSDQAGVAHSVPASFTLNPGGAADGAIIAMHYLERPDARYLLYQTDAGRLVRGRNPR